MRESGKASSVKVYCQWLVRDAERINSQIKLLSADQQRVVDVLLHDVGLNLLCEMREICGHRGSLRIRKQRHQFELPQGRRMAQRPGKTSTSRYAALSDEFLGAR